MGRRKADPLPLDAGRCKPVHSVEARESQLVSLAMDLAERRLREGTASSAEVVEIMRWGSKRSKLEQELNETKIELMKAKKEALESTKRIEELFDEAMHQFRRYNGVFEEGEDDDGTVIY